MRSQLRTTKQYVVEPLSQNRRLIAQIYPRQQTQDREQDYNEFLPFFAAGYSLKQCCLRAWKTCLLAFGFNLIYFNLVVEKYEKNSKADKYSSSDVSCYGWEGQSRF